ncbi:xanthine dehydrogenase family protein subunit M [Pigmentiphaga soli]|uniref:Xanthine dehydrogenase family protein subunit M n=1 Tax=Pigmentiphaga soli TaxID=1007095 RepID=A0ABP8HAS8_9BURK
MKPGPFTHHEPQTLEEAVQMLAEVAPDEGRVLAGGQTLIPAMALRLARPAHLVDINRIESLQRLQAENGFLHIGACVRHAAFHRPPVEGPLGELLAAVVRHIAHLPIRNRGTFCGSVANADGASEWCLAAVTLDAVLVADSVRGRREIPAGEFFLGYMMTALEPDELLSAVRLPLLPAGARFGFEEYSRRAGDFAQAMCLAVFELRDGAMARVRIGVGGVAGSVLRLPAAEAACEGRLPDPAVFAQASAAAAAAIEPADATEEEQDYRRALTHTVVSRALARAAGC